MNYKDMMTIIIIFLIFTILGVRTAEGGMYYIMGLEMTPESFDFNVFNDHSYVFNVMGKDYMFQKLYKIGDFYADRYRIILNVNGKKIKLNPIIYTGVSLKNRINLDKRHANMYN